MIGPDVSEYNGNIDWSKTHDIDFAFCKATEGLTFTDSRLHHNWAGIGSKSGVRRGAYHFARPQSGRTGAQEAKHFLSALHDAGGIRPDDILILDLEATELGAAGTRAHAKSFIDYVRHETDHNVLLYSYLPFFVDNVGGSSTFGTKTWVAAYGQQPSGGSTWVKNMILWQFTDGKYGPTPHSLSGIGSCDISRSIGAEIGSYGAAGSASLSAKLAADRAKAHGLGKWPRLLRNHADQLKARIKLQRYRSRLSAAPKDDSPASQDERRSLRAAIDREKTEIRALRAEAAAL